MNGQTRTSSDAPREASFRTKWMVAIGESDLPPTTRLVAWALGTWMDVNGRCYPQRTEIARRAGVNLDTVKRCLKELQKANYVVWKTGGGPRRPNQYQALTGASDTPVSSEWGVFDGEWGVFDGRNAVKARHDSHQEVRGSIQEEEAKASASSSPNGDSPPQQPEGSPPPWAGTGWKQYLEEQKAKRTEEKKFLAGDPDGTIAQAEPEEANT